MNQYTFFMGVEVSGVVGTIMIHISDNGRL